MKKWLLNMIYKYLIFNIVSFTLIVYSYSIQFWIFAYLNRYKLTMNNIYVAVMFVGYKGRVHRTVKYSMQWRTLFLHTVSKWTPYTFSILVVFWWTSVYDWPDWKATFNLVEPTDLASIHAHLSDEDATRSTNGSDVPRGIKSYHRNGTTKLF